MSNKTNELLSNSKLAFINQQFGRALNLAQEVIAFEPNNPDAYKCAANAYMSMERFDDAINCYQSAVKYDPDNGNRYYDLGFAQASAEKLADAMSSFAKAEEMGCIPENLVQLYNVLGIICFDIGRYDDALVNLSKAEQLIGIDTDILQRKAIIYGIKDDIRSGLHTANQLKLIAPSEYRGYQIAFKLLIQSNRIETAKKELEKAEKYTAPTMDYYFDCITLELSEYQSDNDKEHLTTALSIIEKALKTLHPSVKEVAENYINAAELHLQLEEADKTIDCLNAAQNPAGAFNSGFEVVFNPQEPVELTEYDVEDMIAEDREKIEEQYGEYGLEDLMEGTEPDEEGFSEVHGEAEMYRLNEAELFELTSDNIDQINRLFIGAYTLKQDFNKVVEYSKVLQASENIQNAYIGIYTEANALKEIDAPAADSKYQEVIKYFRNAMIKDPTDIMAVTMRIQCYIDIGDYTEAEKTCGLVTREVREPLLEKIREAQSGGE